MCAVYSKDTNTITVFLKTQQVMGINSAHKGGLTKEFSFSFPVSHIVGSLVIRVRDAELAETAVQTLLWF